MPLRRPQRGADALRRGRNLVDRNAEWRECVVDGVDDGRRRADGAAFAQAFGAGDGRRRRRFDVVQFDRRNFARGRRHVVGERRGLRIAGLVVDDLLEQRVTDALRDAAVHLAVGDHRIDDAAGILHRKEFFDFRAAGLDIDLDDGDVAGIGEGAGRIVVGALAQARRDLAFELMGLMIGGTGQCRDRRCAVGPQNLGVAVFEHDVVRCSLQNMAGDGQQFFADLLRRQQRRAAGNDQRAAGERTPAIGR
jgi:hypothetical protein